MMMSKAKYWTLTRAASERRRRAVDLGSLQRGLQQLQELCRAQ